MGEQGSVVRVFCGYAHEDRALFQHLRDALTVLIRQEDMSVWHYGDLLPARHDAGAARVIPILLKPTPAWETTPLGGSKGFQRMQGQSQPGPTRTKR